MEKSSLTTLLLHSDRQKSRVGRRPVFDLLLTATVTPTSQLLTGIDNSSCHASVYNVSFSVTHMPRHFERGEIVPFLPGTPPGQPVGHGWTDHGGVNVPGFCNVKV